MSEKKRYYEITPGIRIGHDSTIVPAEKETDWKSALQLVEGALDDQYNGGDWSEIKVTIKCLEMTDEEFNDLVLED